VPLDEELSSTSLADSRTHTSATPDTDENSAEQNIFRDVDAAVDEASDTICSVGFSVVVENDDSQDAEER
jgi:hypothetical protein